MKAKARARAALSVANASLTGNTWLTCVKGNGHSVSRTKHLSKARKGRRVTEKPLLGIEQPIECRLISGNGNGGHSKSRHILNPTRPLPPITRNAEWMRKNVEWLRQQAESGTPATGDDLIEDEDYIVSIPIDSV